MQGIGSLGSGVTARIWVLEAVFPETLAGVKGIGEGAG